MFIETAVFSLKYIMTFLMRKIQTVSEWSANLLKQTDITNRKSTYPSNMMISWAEMTLRKIPAG